jgi:hypothetical protein
MHRDIFSAPARILDICAAVYSGPLVASSCAGRRFVDRDGTQVMISSPLGEMWICSIIISPFPPEPDPTLDPPATTVSGDLGNWIFVPATRRCRV